MHSPTPNTNPMRYELRFQSLFHSGRGFSFPCDSEGHVNMQSLSERSRESYLHARAIVGLELAAPAIQRSMLH